MTETQEPPERTAVPPEELTGDQQAAIDGILEWLESGREQEKSLGGYAGTGKTTVINHLLFNHAEDIAEHVGPLVATAAFTGKAASVLRSKGLPGQTLHSLMYKLAGTRVVSAAKGGSDIPNPFGKSAPAAKRTELDFRCVPAIGCDFVIVDEASMINRRLRDDLISYGKPVLWVGDMGQLEPIGDNPNLMADPDFRLEKIHRQAEHSDIIKLSVGVRAGWSPAQFKPQGELGREVVIGDRTTFNRSLEGADQIICGYNETRHITNKKVRKMQGRVDVVEPGDRVICLRNNADVGVFNGMICHVTAVKKIGDDTITASVEDGAGAEFSDLTMVRRQFGANNISTGSFRPRDYETMWDYGYCVTAHKSQGSEYRRVLVMEEIHSQWDANRWRYTAITRAANRLIYCM